jgi:hypothetical protein
MKGRTDQREKVTLGIRSHSDFGEWKIFIYK